MRPVSAQPEVPKSIARIFLPETGVSLTTPAVLNFKLGLALAKMAVNSPLVVSELALKLSNISRVLLLHTQVRNRNDYLLNPNLGRRLDKHSKNQLLKLKPQRCDISIIIGDGLSSEAVQNYAAVLVKNLWRIFTKNKLSLAPLCIVDQARVAVENEIGYYLKANIAIMIIGERPGLTVRDSLGLYLIYQPEVGKTDECRQCISNIHPLGLSIKLASEQCYELCLEMLRQKTSGVTLKCSYVSKNNL
ncbi:MAG: ethanolamine ammonia-lyase subunit EutC [Alphaproteobacteria bacterium]|nr:ethanolamine ammonia-lyase subunit EutC [Alphaproteobacteria bacterium]